MPDFVTIRKGEQQSYMYIVAFGGGGGGGWSEGAKKEKMEKDL